MNKKITLLLILSLLLSFNCVTTSNKNFQTDRSINRYIRTELYFGLSKPTGGIITENEWQNFVNDIITPLFKNGYTTIDAEGRWLDVQAHKTITEKTKIIIIIYKKSKYTDDAINKIIETYKKMFDQQAVMQLDFEVEVQF